MDWTENKDLYNSAAAFVVTSVYKLSANDGFINSKILVTLEGQILFLWFQVNENGGFGIEMGNCPFSCAVIGKYGLASFGF